MYEMDIWAKQYFNSKSAIMNQASRLMEDLTTQGIGPWVRPWLLGFPCGLSRNLSTGERYNDTNLWTLEAASIVRGYRSSVWGTSEEWRRIGGEIRDHNPVSVDGLSKKNNYQPTLELFNREQVEVDLSCPGIKTPDFNQARTIKDATGARFLIRESECFLYVNESGSYDYIIVPPTRKLSGEEEYWTAIFHELIHWAALPRFRLGLNLGDRAQNELVAELGAALLCDQCGIRHHGDMRAHRMYLEEWRSKFRRNYGYFSKAAQYAQTAAEYILNFQR